MGSRHSERLGARAADTAGVAEGVGREAAAGNLPVGVENLFAEGFEQQGLSQNRAIIDLTRPIGLEWAQVDFADKSKGFIVQPHLYLISSDDMYDPVPFNLYFFGTKLHPLGALSAGVPFRDDPKMISLFVDAHTVCSFLEMVEYYNKTCPSSVEKAREVKQLIERYLRSSEGHQMPASVDDFDAKQFVRKVQEFETLLSDEVSKLPIFCLQEEKVGNLSIKKLLDGASLGYPQKTRSYLTEACKNEIDEAGRCLVFERSTAAGFHILRAVELTIRQYLLAVPGFSMPPLNRQNWGEYLSLLKDNGATKDVTDHLHNIKDNYRNPLMHPEDTLEMDEAVGLFGVAQSMSEMLIADMKKRGFVT